MNCKFCGNFVPDGSDTCPVCGRRPTEDSIGKLLSENQPSTLAVAPTVSEVKSTKEAPQKKVKKGIFAPLLAIAASAAGWVYAWGQGVWDTLRTIFNSMYGESSQLASDSSFDIPGASTGIFGEATTTALLIAGAAILLAIIGIVGVISLFKRLYNRVAYHD